MRQNRGKRTQRKTTDEKKKGEDAKTLIMTQTNEAFN